MKPWRTWLTCLGVLGALAIISGCGGGDVPDPSADGPAAALPEASAPAQPAAPAAPAPQVAAREEKAEEAKTEVAAAAPAPAEAPAAAEQPAPAEKPAGPPAGGSASSPDRSSPTAEMFAMAAKDAAPAAPPAGGDAASGNAPAPGGSGPPGAGGMAPGMQGQQQAMMQQQQMQNAMRAGMQNQGRGNMPPGGPGAGYGAPGASPGGGNNQPPDYRSPEGAVTAFLNALQARDLDRLNDATALRAPTESSKKYSEMFKRITDGTLSESELNSLATQLEGYRIMSENPTKSTGRVEVVLMKTQRNNNPNSGVMGGGAYYHLKVTVRKEKKGWGVCDIGAPTEFKNPTMFNPYRRKR
jgi:hypothetical protein